MSEALRSALAAHGMSTADLCQAVEASTDQDVTERPPQPGLSYRAFVVHPSRPSPQTLAIGHREADRFVVDLLRDGLAIAQVVELVKAYSIDQVTGAENDENDNLPHAIAGVVSLLRDGWS